MHIDDVNGSAVQRRVRELESGFATGDVCDDPGVRAAHGALAFESSYRSAVGRWLSANSSSLGIAKTGRKRGSDGEIWTKGGGPGLSESTSTPDLVRDGHWKGVRLLRSNDFASIRTQFDEHTELGGVYFRVTERGLQPVDLSDDHRKPLIGIGGPIGFGATPAMVEASMSTRLADWRTKRATASSSLERQIHARLVRHALENQLRLGGPGGLGEVGEPLRFVASEWRLGQATQPMLVDLIAVDLEQAALVLIELKAVADASAAGQVQRYQQFVHRKSDDLCPFFEALANAMGRAYACDELAAIDLQRTLADPIVAWPDAAGRLITEVVAPNVTAHKDRVVRGPTLPFGEPYGPQHRGDEPWAARMRFHQSWWRQEVLGAECGVGPTAASTTRYGNMLTAADGQRGTNFLTPSIAAVAEQRIASGGGVEPYRCRCNLLSSQPMAFNLFGPLTLDTDLATTLLSALLPDDVASVGEVMIEWAPTPRAGYLDDRTAFDVFVAAIDPSGHRVAIGIECKLTEPFSPTVDTTGKYLAHAQSNPTIWDPARRDELAGARWMQLWRNHLLCHTLANKHPDRFDRPLSLVVGHPRDPTLCQAVDGYRELLTTQGQQTVQPVTLDQILDCWQEAAPQDDETHAWVSAFNRRYLDLSLSEPAWTRTEGRPS